MSEIKHTHTHTCICTSGENQQQKRIDRRISEVEKGTFEIIKSDQENRQNKTKRMNVFETNWILLREKTDYEQNREDQAKVREKLFNEIVAEKVLSLGRHLET